MLFFEHVSPFDRKQVYEGSRVFDKTCNGCWNGLETLDYIRHLYIKCSALRATDVQFIPYASTPPEISQTSYSSFGEKDINNLVEDCESQMCI